MYTTVGLGLHLKKKYFPISQVVVRISYTAYHWHNVH